MTQDHRIGRGRTAFSTQHDAHPFSASPDPATFISGFLTRRAATLHYVRRSTDSLHHHFAPLGPLGDLDGYQWLLLLASHTDRHVAQIQEVKAQSGYPD